MITPPATLSIVVPGFESWDVAGTDFKVLSYDKIPAIKGEKRINARVDLSLNAEPQHRMDPRSFHRTESFPGREGKRKSST